jgi:hypothetical protein
MKRCYIPKRFEPKTMRAIQQADAILAEYYNQGFTLTLRSLYYKFVARGLFPDDRKWRWSGKKWVRDKNGTKNAQPNYTWLKKICTDGRLSGYIDWIHMIDNTRNLEALETYESIPDALRKVAGWYHIDMWANQQYRPEIWIEKDAVAGFVRRVCQENDVPFFSCRGYTSLSEMWKASIRLRDHMNDDHQPYIIHFGDHDPSGIDMSRDITDRLQETFMADCTFQRVALTMEQVNSFNPPLPCDPAKVTDSRYKAYVKKFGDDSWELDAIEPAKFRELIEEQINGIRNKAQWKRDLENEKDKSAELAKLAENYHLMPSPYSVKPKKSKKRKPRKKK